jgi:hypothetical protein
MDGDEHVQPYLLPQLALFETAATNERLAEEGLRERQQLRQRAFYDNAWQHWCAAVREPQAPARRLVRCRLRPQQPALG